MNNGHWFAATVIGLLSVMSTERSASAQIPDGSQPVVEYQSNGLPIGVPETTGGIHGEPMQRYGTEHPWMHGYIQEIPPYSGYAAFRPYNYKHVLSQAQVAGGWGMSPKMPYSQQYWHRYHNRALMISEPIHSGRRTLPESSNGPRMTNAPEENRVIISPAAFQGRRR